MFPVKMFPSEQIKRVNEKRLNILTPWYITGFCEGEAAFTYSRNGKGFALYFAIKSNAEDSSLIAQVRDFFGVGQIYKVKPRAPKAYSGVTREAVYYRTTKISHLERIITHFDNYPLVGKKRLSYQIWREMVLLKRNFRKPNRAKLQELASALSNLSSKNTASKRKWQHG